MSIACLLGARCPRRPRVIDRLTTNETYFFREREHFRHFAGLLEQQPQRRWQVWSAACSSGARRSAAPGDAAGRPPGLAEQRWQIRH
ncbi:MAG: CheR family methyltransferase [Rubrivivax sp.]